MRTLVKSNAQQQFVVAAHHIFHFGRERSVAIERGIDSHALAGRKRQAVGNRYPRIERHVRERESLALRVKILQ